MGKNNKPSLIRKARWAVFATGLMMLSIMACNSVPDETTLDLRFTLSYDDQPLVAFDQLTYGLGYEVFFTKYSLFLSDITLHNESGDYLLSEVEFLDLLTDVNDEASAIAGQKRTYLSVPTGEYDAISFNIGLPSTVNATTPASYANDHPLSNNGEYWVGWSSYIFHKIEGKMDTDGDSEPDASIALHIGSDQAFRQARINAPIDFDEETETLVINFDLAQILELSAGFYDFIDTPQIHHLGVLPKALPILDNTIVNIELNQM